MEALIELLRRGTPLGTALQLLNITLTDKVIDDLTGYSTVTCLFCGKHYPAEKLVLDLERMAIFCPHCHE